MALNAQAIRLEHVMSSQRSLFDAAREIPAEDAELLCNTDSAIDLAT